MQSVINYYVENVAYKLKYSKTIFSWVREIIQLENKKTGDISFIFCDDFYLYKLNMEFLKHKTLTDIITFDYSEQDIISGDIFISLDRVEENATKFIKTLNDELYRVMCHGILHLTGYTDKKKTERLGMRTKEDYYLSVLYKKLKRST